MNQDEIIDAIVQYELMGYNEAIADCIKIIIRYLKRFEKQGYIRAVISMIVNDIVALKEKEEDL